MIDYEISVFHKTKLPGTIILKNIISSYPLFLEKCLKVCENLH